MSLGATLGGLFRRDAAHYLYAHIEPEHVAGSSADGEALQAGRDYFRIWLSEMYLKRDRDWFQSWHPAVQSLVHLRHGDRDVEIPHIAGRLMLDAMNAANLDRMVGLNFPMTNLLPFSGGVVEIFAGLLAIPGGNNVGWFIDMLGDFAGLLSVPQLSAALAVAAPVARGIEQLITTTNGGLHLGLHQAFVGKGGGGGNELRPGYVAVIRAQEHEVEPGHLWVDGDRLRHGERASQAQPLTGYEYLLFRIEKRTERDDWEGLTGIQDPFNQALDALAERAAAKAESLMRMAILAVLKSPDLTRTDRRRVAQALRDAFDDAQDAGLAAVRNDTRGLRDLMQRAMPVEQAGALGEPALEEFFPS